MSNCRVVRDKISVKTFKIGLSHFYIHTAVGTVIIILVEILSHEKHMVMYCGLCVFVCVCVCVCVCRP